MSAPNGLADVVSLIRTKRVQVWEQNGELRFRAPRGTLTGEELQHLRSSATQILELLQRTDDQRDRGPLLLPRDASERIPLAYSQLCHWHERRLATRPGIRQIVSALRIRGELDVQLLERSFVAVIRRHEALRTVIVLDDDEPVQEVREEAEFALRVDDLSSLAEGDRPAAIQRSIDELVLEPVHVAVGPMLRARLVRLAAEEHALLVAIEHMVSDAFSMNVLLRDLLNFYASTRARTELSLPPVRIQFGDYAIWLRKRQEFWLKRHEKYWEHRLRGCGALRFPEDRSCSTPQAKGRDVVPLCIDQNTKLDLYQWCRSAQTTPVLVVFTAFVALVLRWCEAPEAIIRYQTDGRTAAHIENTIGFFAAVLNLRLQMASSDTFASLLERVTREYCNAYENADFCFLDARQAQPPAFASNPGFNWVSQEPKSIATQRSREIGGLLVAPIPFVHPLTRINERGNEPSVLFYEGDEEITGGVYFPLNRFSPQTMERFSRGLIQFLHVMMSDSRRRVMAVSIP